MTQAVRAEAGAPSVRAGWWQARGWQAARNCAQVPVFRIKVFGVHATGGNSSPYLGLEVVCDPEAQNYRPRPSQGGADGNCYSTYRKVAEGIYEIY